MAGFEPILRALYRRPQLARMRLAALLRAPVWMLLGGLALAAVAHSDPGQDRQRFLEAEAALTRGDMAAYHRHYRRLRDYPLRPYLRYAALTRDLGAADRSAVLAFLHENDDTPLSWRLRSAWLDHLAAEDRWTDYIEDYRTTSDASLRCYYHLAQLRTGADNAAWRGAESLWMTARSQVSACDPLFEAWRQSAAFEAKHVRQRIRLAGQAGNASLVRYLAGLLAPSAQAGERLWLTAIRDPLAALRDNTLDEHPDAEAIADAALMRVAREHPKSLLLEWGETAASAPATQAGRRQALNYAALLLAVRQDPMAWQAMHRLGPEQVDPALAQWRLRWALHREDWDRVLAAYHLLPAHFQADNQWRYWYGRALAALGRAEEAEDIFAKVAGERSFYGFLAADRLDLAYALGHRPLSVPEAQIDELRRRRDFRRMTELNALGRRLALRREWFHAMPTLDFSERLAAAVIASDWGQHRLAIATLGNLAQWSDLKRRFPVAFDQAITTQSRDTGLDPALLYAIVRRESAFDPLAASPVGARGLMQLMPATARGLSSAANEHEDLYDPSTNIALGSRYLKQLINRYGGHLALSAAAYNAGPERVTDWLPHDKAIAADIWIETIPYRETREYVAAVLTYRAIYQARLDRPQTALSDALGVIKPSLRTAAIATR